MANFPLSIDADYLEVQRAWSTATFGPGPRTSGVVDHIRKELNEIEGDPTDLEEWVDVIILALDGAQRLGTPVQDVLDLVHTKLHKNMRREWPDWRTAPDGKAIEHRHSPGEVIEGLIKSGIDRWAAIRVVEAVDSDTVYSRDHLVQDLVMRGIWQDVAEETVDRVIRELKG